VPRNSQPNLEKAYREFLKTQAPSKKEEAGKNLIRAIFGKRAVTT
jgi:hypothetical protein